MSMLTQGTQVFALLPTIANPSVLEVVEIQCATAFNPGGSPASQIDDTCLDETVAQRFKRGLRAPGQATLTVRADPRNGSHVRLHELAEGDNDDDVKWVVGWSDGKGILPTVNVAGDDFVLPTTRTWFAFEGYVADFPFDFAQNTTVTSAVSIQRSGPAVWIKKA